MIDLDEYEMKTMLLVTICLVCLLVIPINSIQGLPVFLACTYDSDFVGSANKFEFVPDETFVLNTKTTQNDDIFEIVVIDPKGKEVFADISYADKNGYSHTRFHIPDNAQRGTWSVFVNALPSAQQEVIFFGVNEPPQYTLVIKPSSVNYEYKVDDASFLVAGKPNTDIQVNMLDHDDEIMHVYIVKIPSEGKCNFILDLDEYKPGVYAVEVSDHIDHATAVFTVGLEPTKGIIAIRTDSDSYFSGDRVSVLGDTAPNLPLTIDLVDPLENTVNHFSVVSGDLGTINTSFNLPTNAKNGTWTVRAISEPNFDSVEFNVIQKSPADQHESLVLDPDPVLDLWNNHAEIIDGTIVSKTVYPSMGKGMTEFHVKVNKFFKPLSKNTESITLFASYEDSNIPSIFNEGDRALIYIESGNNISKYSVKVDKSTYCEPRDYIQIGPVLPNDPNQLVRGPPTLPFDWKDQCVADYFTKDPNFWVYREYQPPIHQWNVHNIPIEEQRCSGEGDDFASIQKTGNHVYKYCVKPESVTKLIERGWAKPLNQDRITVSFSFCGEEGFDSDGNLNKSNSTHIWDVNECQWYRITSPLNENNVYSVPFGMSQDYLNQMFADPVYLTNPDNGELVLDIDTMVHVQKILNKCDYMQKLESGEIPAQNPDGSHNAVTSSLLFYNNGTHYIDTHFCKWVDSLELLTYHCFDAKPSEQNWYFGPSYFDNGTHYLDRHYCKWGVQNESDTHILKYSPVLFSGTGIDLQEDELMNHLKNKREHLANSIDDVDAKGMYPITGMSFSIGNNAYSLDEKYDGSPIALNINVLKEKFTKETLEQINEFVRKYVGDEIDIVYSKGSYAVPTPLINESKNKSEIINECKNIGGTWLDEHNECESYSMEEYFANFCSDHGGKYDGCATNCRNFSPESNRVCTAQCIAVCEFEN